MKTISLIFVLFFCFISICHSQEITEKNNIDVPGTKRATVFLGYNFLGKHTETSGAIADNPNVNSGISLGFEFDFIKSEFDIMRFGVGAFYQFSRKQINSDKGFSFLPVYAFFKISIFKEMNSYGFEKFRVYIIPAFGYDFLWGNKKYLQGSENQGGFYNSIGLGLLAGNKLDIKLIYQFDRGCLKSKREEIEILYRYLDLNCGYYF